MTLLVLLTRNFSHTLLVAASLHLYYLLLLIKGTNAINAFDLVTKKVDKIADVTV